MTYTPGSNTLVYFPFKDSNDTLVGSAIRSYSSNVTYTTEYGGVANGGGLSINYYSDKKSYATFSVWVNCNASFHGGGGTYPEFIFNSIGATFYDAAWGRRTSVSFEEGWHNIVISNSDSGHKKVYVDGEFKQITYSDNVLSGNGYSEGSFGVLSTGGFLSEWIVEDVNWTEEQIVAYYNENKSRFEFTPDINHWDTQGPCPDGFHVPTKTDWENVVNVGISLGRRTTASGDGIKNYLKLPYCGEINGSSAAFSDKGSRGYYWMSTAYDNNAEGCYLLTGSSYVRADQKTYRTYGHSIRPFKNSPVVPDSTWTVIYQGTGNAGIFHNASLGLISISSDGVTWYTIADKNLGATTVYNNGNTLSEANCGNFYQRGNNYQFSWSTSPSVLYTTQTNASGYGPGNYYTNAGFIKRTSSPFGWDSSDNRNLWGGVTDRRVYPPYEGNELCFTANTAGSTIKLAQTGSPTSVSLETSKDGYAWTDYTIDNTITLTNEGDKVWFRNKSETVTGFSKGESNFYRFEMTGSIAGSGDTTYLLCKNGTNELNNFCFALLFQGCTSLTAAPELPATTLGWYCYFKMFQNCINLTTLPGLPATTLTTYCYYYMFESCTKIKLSTTKTGEYQTTYRIPTSGTGTTASSALIDMFLNTGGTFTRTPSINTTYYTSNTVVPDPTPAFSYTGIFWYDETDTEYENPLKPSQTTTTPIAGYPDITETIGSYLNRVVSGWDVITGYNFSKISILNHDGDVIKEVDVNYIPTLDDFDDDGGKNSLSILISFKKKKAIRKVKKIINNGNTYKAGVQYPDGGEDGQVLMKTNTGTGWGTPEAGVPGIGIDNIVVCTESEYSSATYENGIFYFVRED